MLARANSPRQVQRLCLPHAAPYNKHSVLFPHYTASAVVLGQKPHISQKPELSDHTTVHTTQHGSGRLYT
jgi:hypothetical protein